MASEWRGCTIGELCDAGVVELQTGPFGTQLHAHDYVEDGVPVVPTEAIRDRQIDHSVLPKISPGKAVELARHRLELGDILFARRGVQATGHIGCVREAEDGFLCGTGAIRLRVRRGGSSVSSDFLSHVLANPASVEWFKFHAIGATMPNLNEGIIRSFPLRIPPLPEQRAIAHILGTLDDKIELNRQMNETLEAMARALFKSWFVDFDPVRAKAEGRDPGLAKPLADLFSDSFEDSEIVKIPRGWRLGTLADLAGTDRNAIVDGPFGTQMKIAEYRIEGIPVVEMPYLEGMPFYKPFENFISQEKFETVKRSSVLPGDIVISKTGTLGLLGVMTTMYPVGVLVSRLAKITAHPDKSDRYFVMGILKEHQANHYWDRVSSGSTMPIVNLTHIKTAPSIIPPASIQRAYGGAAQTIYARIHASASESSTLKDVRDTLLPKLISGEIRVKAINNQLQSV